ncbi:MAG: AAA family ATPase [Fimbriimonadaceae bacterium]|nr:AAA family ATPase [Chthonomonadaceae bacterium]MCO5295724.1 AAA family ATPase [Fimbriimonadaceae bacterium]
MPDASPSPSREILDRILEQPPSDPKTANLLAALREAVDRDERDREETQRLIQEYEEAYNKLTSPANRVGVFLRWLEDGRAQVALGDTEFVAEVDPALDAETLVSGTRVRLNDAYAVVGSVETGSDGALARVGEVLEDGRLRLQSAAPGTDGGRLVLRSAALQDTVIASGDEVRLDATGRIALEHFAKRETRDYFFEDVPEIPWEKVGGQEEAIHLIRETIEQPLLHPELYAKFDKKPVKGILLYGPPGCGKTLIGKATAHNLTKEYAKRVGHDVKEYFMVISGPKILNMWLGETERIVREIFQTAREKAAEGRLVFIFMDEAESVLRTRSSGRWLNISNTVVPQFCAELDGLVALENVVLMLTSNRPDYIDPAVLRPERIDRKVKVSRPDKAASTQILAIYLHDRIPIDPLVVKRNKGEIDCARKELVEGTVEFLWRRSTETEFLKVFMRNGSSETLYWKDLVSGALLKSVVDRSKDLAIRRAIANPSGEEGVTLDDLKRAVEAEYRENEIFPKSDVQEDWLRLLDFEREAVASIKPIRPDRGDEFVRNSVI